MLNPSEADVRFLCDRRQGIGADGLLRAVKADRVPEWTGPGGLWFMDYRNCDGSIAEMCGNGLRVFVHWLLEEGLVDGDVIDIATRAGLRRARVTRDGRICVYMGVPHWDEKPTTIHLGDREFTGHAVDVGNPHCVIRLTTPQELVALDLRSPIQSDLAAGINVEFVVDLGENRLRMRVQERGVGETPSCGKGVVAACCDAQQRHSSPTYRVEVPGGRLKVDFTEDGEALLTGPAIIVARGEVTLPDD